MCKWQSWCRWCEKIKCNENVRKNYIEDDLSIRGRGYPLFLWKNTLWKKHSLEKYILEKNHFGNIEFWKLLVCKRSVTPFVTTFTMRHDGGNCWRSNIRVECTFTLKGFNLRHRRLNLGLHHESIHSDHNPNSERIGIFPPTCIHSN